MKKILAIILAVLLTFGVTVTAFATNKVTLPSKADAAEYDKTYSSSSKKTKWYTINAVTTSVLCSTEGSKINNSSKVIHVASASETTSTGTTIQNTLNIFKTVYNMLAPLLTELLPKIIQAFASLSQLIKA